MKLYLIATEQSAHFNTLSIPICDDILENFSESRDFFVPTRTYLQI